MLQPASEAAGSSCGSSGENGNAVATETRRLKIGSALLCEWRWRNFNDGLQAVAYVSHGFADHCLYFNELAQLLAANDFLVVGHDFVGHGLSEGSIDCVGSFRQLAQHTVEHLDRLREEHPSLRFHGIGYSLGAIVLQQVSRQRPELLQSVAWISPALQPVGMQPTAGKLKLLRLLASCRPNLPIPGATFSPEQLTRNEAVAEQIRTDVRIRQRRLQARCAALMVELMLDTRPEDVHIPLFVAVGTADRVADHRRTLAFVGEAQRLGKSVLLRLFPDCRHQLHTDWPPAGTALHHELLLWLRSFPAA